MEQSAMQPWKTLSRRIALDMGYFLKVESHTVELPNGRVIQDWPWVISPDYVNILVETSDERYLLFRQTKYSVDGLTLAPVGGYLRAGENPLEGAKREMLEETGYESQDWIHLGSYRIDANRGIGSAHLYLARAAHLVTEPHSDDLEEQQLLQLTRSELNDALEAGEFKILAWAMVIALGLLHIQKT
jgi:ADP-ribose pyrophosphatase YjhB (NUDIX family)